MTSRYFGYQELIGIRFTSPVDALDFSGGHSLERLLASHLLYLYRAAHGAKMMSSGSFLRRVYRTILWLY